MPNPYITPQEVLAIARIRQWTCDRAALRSAHTCEYKRSGWTPRSSRTHDARIVRVIDFERALARLPEEEQAILMLIYRDREGFRRTSQTMRCSNRKLSYALPIARTHLAAELERLDLL